jgi:hypothetical protein
MAMRGSRRNWNFFDRKNKIKDIYLFIYLFSLQHVNPSGAAAKPSVPTAMCGSRQNWIFFE